MTTTVFSSFFQGEAEEFLLSAIRSALDEDGEDLTSNAVFSPDDSLYATIVAKEDSFVAGLPILPLVLRETAALEPGAWNLKQKKDEGGRVQKGAVIAEISGSARVILRAERVMLNFLCHLSGIANLVSEYVKAIEGTGVRLLDTRKTLPGLRYPEKYAVLIGGGYNHRRNLSEMLMLKDNHIEAAGSIAKAVERVEAVRPGSKVEVECARLREVQEAVECGVFRIMLDNMTTDMMAEALQMVPPSIEVEISGNVSLDNIRSLCLVDSPRKPDFISVGKVTHSAPYADFSMRVAARGYMAYSRL